MNSLIPKPLSNYITRFLVQHEEVFSGPENEFVDFIERSPSKINNMIMSGLGSCTLLLRLGSVINLCSKLDKDESKDDSVLLKGIIENLKETMPSDTNWKNIWLLSCDTSSEWAVFSKSSLGNLSALERFISFRNKFVHDLISVRVKDEKKLSEGIKTMYLLCTELGSLFNNSAIEEISGVYFFVKEGVKTSLHPFVQKGKSDGLPYVFQGIRSQKSTVELINTFYGNIDRQSNLESYNKVFDPMINLLKGGGGKIFNHEDKIKYYNKCFVGRDEEMNEILEWAMSSNGQNILPIYSDAGMGKGALISNLVSQLKIRNTPVLFHFCDDGLTNNLHAVLYHFILLGKKNQFWDEDSPIKKNNSLPTKYSDAITLFQTLITNNFKQTKKNSSGNIVVIVDGLDNAFLSHPMYNISDLFKTYSKAGTQIGVWKSNSNIKWVFTYRNGFYDFPLKNNIYTLSKVQPLVGLSEASISGALSKFSPSEEFIKGVLKKGVVSD